MTFKVYVKDAAGTGIAGLLVTANNENRGASFSRSTDGAGYADVALLGTGDAHSQAGDRVTLDVYDPQLRFKGKVMGDALVVSAEDQVLEIALDPFV